MDDEVLGQSRQSTSWYGATCFSRGSRTTSDGAPAGAPGVGAGPGAVGALSHTRKKLSCGG